MSISLSPIYNGVQFFDNDGLPLAGGKVWAFEAGSSTTAQATYSEANENSPNPHPIVLTSSGRLPVDIWLDDSARYNFVLTTADGVTVLDAVDGVSSILDETLIDEKLENLEDVYLRTSGGTVTGALAVEGSTSLQGVTIGGALTAQAITATGLNLANNKIQGVALPTEGTDAASKAYVDDVAGGVNVVPIGTVLAFAAQTVPASWLECNGQVISRTDYAPLFEVIGTAYGAGDGTNTFAIPDLRGNFVRGWDAGLGVDVNRVFGSFQADASQRVRGYFGVDDRIVNTGVGAFRVNGSATANAYALGAPAPDTTSEGGDGITQYAEFDNNHVARTAEETRPRNVAMKYIIKAG